MMFVLEVNLNKYNTVAYINRIVNIKKIVT